MRQIRRNLACTRVTLGLAICAAVLLTAVVSGCAGSMSQAAKLEQLGQYASAIALYEQVAEANPGSKDALAAHLSIADVYMTGLNQPEQAVAAYRQVADADQSGEAGLTARYKMALHYYRADEYAAAADLFAEIVNNAPTSDTGANAQLMLAKTHEKAGQLEEAERTYGAFSALHPEDTKAALAMETRAKLLERLGNRTEAIRTRQKLVRDYGAELESREVVAMATQGLRDQGASVPEPVTIATMSQGQRAQVRRAEVRDRDRPASARDDARRRAANTIFGVSADEIMGQMSINYDGQGTMHDTMFTMANVMFTSMDYKKAGALYQRSIEVAESEGTGSSWENLGPAYKGLADVYRKLGLEALATEFLMKALQRNPKVFDQIIDGGLVDFGSGNYETAVATWESLVGVHVGRDGDLYYNIGQAYKELGDTPNEVIAFERAVAAKPRNMEAVQSLAEALYYRAGQRTRSYLFQDIVDGKPTAEAYAEIGKVALRHGYFMNAQLQFNIGARAAARQEDTTLEAGLKALKAVAKGKRDEELIAEATAELDALAVEYPENPAVIYANGLHAVTRGDVEKAIASFQQVIEREPRNARVVRELADLHLSRDNAPAALEVYSACVQRNPRDKSVLRLRDNLRIQLGGAATPVEVQAEPSAPQEPAAP